MIPYIDTHIHFWDPNQLHYPGLDDESAIGGRHDLKVLAAASAGLDLQKIVFVQAECLPEQGLDEVRWVSGLASEDPRIEGIVAWAPMNQGIAVRDYLAQLKSFSLVKGVRQLIQSEGPGFSCQPDFIQGIQQLPDFGYSFDICVFHHQLPDVLQLVEACPDVFFILDHIAKPDIKNGLIEPWATDVQTLAGFPSVVCKFSGMVTEADHQRWTPADLQPYVDHIVAAFGSDRLMFGGDWPVNELATPYRKWVETAWAALAHLPEQDLLKIFYQNAIQFYRL